MERILLISTRSFKLPDSSCISVTAMTLKTCLASLLLTLGFAASSAHATLLQDKTVTIEYFYPQFGTVFDTGTNGDYVVGDEVEIADFYFGYASLDISDKALTISFLGQDTIMAAPYLNGFNGFRLSVAPGHTDDFVSVLINSAATTWDAFTASRLSFGADYILIDWQELSFTPGATLVLDIHANPQPVPEPASVLLIGIALLGFAVSRHSAKLRRG